MIWENHRIFTKGMRMVNRNVSYRYMNLRFSVYVCISRLTVWPIDLREMAFLATTRSEMVFLVLSTQIGTSTRAIGKFYTSADSANSTNTVIFEITTVTQKILLTAELK